MMKIYVHQNGVTLVGKAWEIKEKLKTYGKSYAYVKEWIDDIAGSDNAQKVKENEHKHRS